MFSFDKLLRGDFTKPRTQFPRADQMQPPAASNGHMTGSTALTSSSNIAQARPGLTSTMQPPLDIPAIARTPSQVQQLRASAGQSQRMSALVTPSPSPTPAQQARHNQQFMQQYQAQQHYSPQTQSPSVGQQQCHFYQQHAHMMGQQHQQQHQLFQQQQNNQGANSTRLSAFGQPTQPMSAHASVQAQAQRMAQAASHMPQLAAPGGMGKSSAQVPKQLSLHTPANPPRASQSPHAATPASLTYGAAQHMPIDLTSEPATSKTKGLQTATPAEYYRVQQGQVQRGNGLTALEVGRAWNGPSANNQRRPSEQSQPMLHQNHPLKKEQGSYLPSPQATPRMSPHTLGQKRGSDAMTSASSQPYKRQAASGTNGAPVARAVQAMQDPTTTRRLTAQYAKQLQQDSQQSPQAQAEARKKAEWDELRAKEVTRQKLLKEEECQRLLREQALAAGKTAEDRRIAYNKTQAEKIAVKKRIQEEEAYAAAIAEEYRVTTEARLQSERKVMRKEELRKDPSALYRHYQEYIQFHPLNRDAGERKDPYLNMLLANRLMPYVNGDDIGLAITYAKEHWEMYMRYPKDIKYAADAQRKKLAKIAAGGSQEKR